MVSLWLCEVINFIEALNNPIDILFWNLNSDIFLYLAISKSIWLINFLFFVPFLELIEFFFYNLAGIKYKK